MNPAAPEVEKETTEEPVADTKTEIEDLVDHLKEYINTGRELFILKIMHKAFRASTASMVWGIVIFFSLLAFLFLSFAAALYLGEIFKDNWLGFLVVAGFYVLLAVIIYIGREKFIKRPLENKMIEHLINDE